MVVMTDAVITEFTGTRRDTIRRIYRYGNGGIRVYNGNSALRRLYRFDPSTNMMTERDIAREDKIHRRCVFDNFGMLEETFSFGERPRNFHYEDGARRIVVREGGERGAVGKTFTFEGKGISETAWGRDGEIERVFVFEPGNTSIVVRLGGWYGDVDRMFVFDGIGASLFREPEAFLQFLMFIDISEEERDELPRSRPAATSRVEPEAPRSRFAYTGIRHTSSDDGSGDRGDSGFGSGPARGSANPSVRAGTPPSRPSSEISFNERWQGDSPSREFVRVKPGDQTSRDISFEERRQGLQSSREGPPDRSGPRIGGGVSFEERWQAAQSQRDTPRPQSGDRTSRDISFDERRQSDPTPRGGPVDRFGPRIGGGVSFEERWQAAQPQRDAPRPRSGERTSRDISFEERKSGELTPRDEAAENPRDKPSRDISFEERRKGRSL